MNSNPLDRFSTFGDSGSLRGVVTLPADAVDRYRARMIERGETPLPEDGERCEWCGQETDDPCSDECDCPDCEVSRALDDDADMWSDR